MAALTAVVARIDDVFHGQRGHLLPWAPVALASGIGVYFALPVEPGGAAYAVVALAGALAAWAAWRRPGGWLVLGWAAALMAAGGWVVHTFPTGQGNIIGNPILPVIKISGNPRTLRTMSEHIDVDVTGVLTREMTIDAAGDALIEMIVRTANGRATAAEALGHREFSMTKLYRSA